MKIQSLNENRFEISIKNTNIENNNKNIYTQLQIYLKVNRKQKGKFQR